MIEIKWKQFGIIAFFVLVGCGMKDSNFSTLRFDNYNFALYLEDTLPKDVSIEGNLKSEMDGVMTFKLVGNGKVVTPKHTIVVKENELIIDGKSTIKMNNTPPFTMILKNNGELKDGFLRSFD
jgi:hypothetical protein